jgi:1-acyl-sn-glycerol-3-phosphate acyltransferase
MLPFAPGAFKLSVKKNIPLLPIHIIGSDQILSKANSLLSIRPGTVEIHLMPPVTLTKSNYKFDIDSFEKIFRTQNKEMLQAFNNNAHSKG